MADAWTPPADAFQEGPTAPWIPPAGAFAGAPAPAHAFEPRTAQGFFEHVTAGWQASSTGLFLRGKVPDTYNNPEAAWYERIGSSVVGLAGDIVPMGVGGGIGMAVPLPGMGKLVAAGAGSFAAPAVVREALMEYYEKGTVSPGKLALTAAKQGAVGALTFATGGVIGRMLPEVAAAAGLGARVAGGLGRQAAIAGGEVTAMVGAQSVLDWRLPTAHEFLDNAILIFGLRAAREVGVPALRAIYERTGKTPPEVAVDAANDSVVAQDVLAGKIPRKYVEEPVVQSKVSDTPSKEPARPIEPLDVAPDAVRKHEYNLRHFDTQEGMHGALAILAEEHAGMIELARRGTMSMSQIKAEARGTAEWLAQTVGEGKKTRDPGDASSAGEIMAYGKLLSASFENTRKAAADVETVTLQVKAGKADKEVLTDMLADYALQEAKLKAIMADYLGAAAESGRAMRTIQEISKSIGDTKKIQAALEQRGGMPAFLNRAGIVHETPTQKALANLMKTSSFFDKVIEYWKASILSGPVTQAVNLTSNVMFGSTRIPRDFVAAMISEARGKDTVMYREVAGEVFGMFAGMLEGMRAGSRVMRDHFVLGVESGSGKAEAYKGHIGTAEGASGAARVAGKIVRTPFAALSAMDAMAKVVNGYMTAYGHAARASKGNIGKLLSPEFYAEKSKGVIDRKTGEIKLDDSSLAKMMTEDGLRYTFQTELGSAGKRMMAALYDVPGVRYVVPFILPFVRTPVNIYSEAIRHLPILAFASKRAREEWAAGGARRERAAAEQVLGAASAVTVIALAQSGVLTGGGPVDPDSRRAWMEAGNQPYSVRIGNTWYSYRRIEPFATIIGMTADLWGTKEYASDAEYDLASKALGYLFVNQVTNKTFMQSISTLANMINPTEMGGTGFGHAIGDIATGFIPNLLSQTDRVLDPHIREARTFIDRIQNRVPYLRRGLLPKRDLFGEAIPHDRFFDAMGIQVSQDKGDPVRDEMARLGYAPRQLTAKEIDLVPGPLEGKVEYSDEQFDALRTESGKLAHRLLGEIMPTQGYRDAPEAYKRAIIEQVFSATRLQARYGVTTPAQMQKALEQAQQSLAR